MNPAVKNNIIIFGTGGLAQFLTKHIARTTNIIAYLNTINTEPIGNIPVIGMKELKNYSYDYIVVAFSNFQRGMELLLQGNTPPRKIIGYSFNGAFLYKDNLIQKHCNDYIHEILMDSKIPELFDLPPKTFYLCAMNIQETEVIEKDFVREQTLALITQEIQRKKLPGECAELGVYKGEFSKKINNLLPDKKLFLFDTFEGFDVRDIRQSTTINWGDNLHAFEETFLDEILHSMPHKENCIIKKGYFPDTWDLDEKFCFVSIDADLYEPIKRGLEIFYPRLVKGGYIMVHDYNNISWFGARNAVIEYCDENEISYVPIPDISGTIIITK